MEGKKQPNVNNGSIGQFFTPSYVAEFMVKNLVEIVERNDKSISISDLKVLEPSVGEGIFLRYINNYDFSSIIAYEMDTSLKNQLLKAYPNIDFRFDNFFSSDLDEKFDIIIGNPPYLGQNYNAEVFQEYIKKYPICKKYFVGNMDLFYYFIHLGIEKLNPGGLLSFITTNYWITKSKNTGIKYLKPHILDETFLLQYIDLSELKIFPDARGQHNCIFVLQKKKNSADTNQSIDVINIQRKIDNKLTDDEYNNEIFNNLLKAGTFNYGNRYISSLTNNDLDKSGNWNLLYPQEIKEIVDYIENLCKVNKKIVYLKDYFMMRNGIIFPKDEIFILQEDKNIKFENEDIYIIIKGKAIKLNESEKTRLKKIYKSKSIEAYSHDNQGFIGYGIFFNKNEFLDSNRTLRNEKYIAKYPNLIAYLNQSEQTLRDILINAKENPDDLFFPRRGAFIRKKHNNKEVLAELEPLYECHSKIFLKYITSENIFGFSKAPYFATSDTYFLWPKQDENEIDYPFILAYLNSSIVAFLFKAKNIIIKRSKSKLEDGIAIPNINLFRSEKEMVILSLIKYLAQRLMNVKLEDFDDSFYRLSVLSYLEDILNEVNTAIKDNDREYMMELIDLLFIELFGLDKDLLDDLLDNYY